MCSTQLIPGTEEGNVTSPISTPCKQAMCLKDGSQVQPSCPSKSDHLPFINDAFHILKVKDVYCIKFQEHSPGKVPGL
jgi:hypothetical protein